MIENNQEQIDNYHSGRMSDSEISEFKEKLDADPSLQSESTFQADVVEGLKEFRKAELKSRLDGINVGPTWFEYAQQSALMKSMGGVIVASVIGAGIYFVGENEKRTSNSVSIIVDAPNIESIDYVWDLSFDKTEETDLSLVAPNNLPITSSKELQQNSSETIVSTDEDNTPDIAVNKADSFKPSFDAPTVGSVEEDDIFVASDLDGITKNGSESIDDEPIEVKTKNSKGSIIKYKYYDGKLFLDGDFKNTPYEILEINSASSRRIYVFYLEKYYQVEVASKLTILPVVTDHKLIDELEMLRENK